MKFEQFQHEMWLKNCEERSAWSEPVLTEEKYREENAAFLLDLYMTKVITDTLDLQSYH